MKNYLNAVECALEHNNKFLIIRRPLGKHAGGLISLPGGTVEEKDEKNNSNMLREAVRREIFEELGLALDDPINYLTSAFFIDSFNNHVIDSIFHCKLEKTIQTITVKKDEVPEYKWMSKEEINDSVEAPEWLKNYINLV